MDELLNWAEALLGLGEDELGIAPMVIRACVVYVIALVMVRWGEKRFMGKSTAFDVILGVVLGSVVSRAITGQSPFVPTICAGFTLVGMHWLFANLAFRSDRFGNLVKGHTRVLIKDGEVDWDEMRRSHLSKDDLLGALRLRGNITGWENVQEARLERNGEISVIPRDG